MNAHEFSARLKPTAVEQLHRKLSRIELMIQELSSEVAALNRAIATEEKKAALATRGTTSIPSMPWPPRNVATICSAPSAT
jgi:hypothetical protein